MRQEIMGFHWQLLDHMCIICTLLPTYSISGLSFYRMDLFLWHSQQFQSSEGISFRFYHHNTQIKLTYTISRSAAVCRHVLCIVVSYCGRDDVINITCIVCQGLVSLTGVIAFAINLSIFWIIGNTSPMTYVGTNVLMTSCFVFILP